MSSDVLVCLFDGLFHKQEKSIKLAFGRIVMLKRMGSLKRFPLSPPAAPLTLHLSLGIGRTSSIVRIQI